MANLQGASVVVSTVSALVTIGLTVWSAVEAHKLEDAKQQLERIRTDLDRQKLLAEQSLQQSELALKQNKQTFDRYDLIQKLIPNMIAKEKTQLVLTVNLVRLALGEEDARVFFEGIELIDHQPETRAIGEVARETFRAVQDEKSARLASLASQLNDEAKAKRLSAAGVLQSQYRSEPAAINALLLQLDARSLDKLTESGRINVLYTLLAADRGAWTAASMSSADEALNRIDERHRSNVSNVGPQTRDLMNRLRGQLDALRGQIGTESR